MWTLGVHRYRIGVMRSISFAENEFYHIYNRAADSKNMFLEQRDVDRFLKGMEQFNTSKILGSLSRGHRVSTSLRLVNFIAYCVNQNHFHFILEQVSDNGIEKFMHKIGMGYAKYFNTKYKRSGALFQGRFKAKHIDSNEYLLHLSAYINLNHLVHGRGHRVSTLSVSSWDEYTKDLVSEEFCKKEMVLEQFKNKKAYEIFAKESLKSIVERKISLEELEDSEVDFINVK